MKHCLHQKCVVIYRPGFYNLKTKKKNKQVTEN